MAFKSYKTGLLLAAGALFAFSLATPATAGFAQGSSDLGQLISRINQLENQVQTLSRSVYRGAKMSDTSVTSAPLADTSALSTYEDRLSQLESQQRDMTGQLERLSYDVQQMKDKVDRVVADNEVRFREMESGKSGTGAYAPSASSFTPSASGSSVRDPAPRDDMGTTVSPNSPDALYDSAFSDIREAKYDTAERKFKDFMTRYPDHALAGNAQYWLAETYYVRADYKQAAKMFAQSYQDYPQGAKAGDSLLKLGMSLGKLGKTDDACLSYQQLLKDFPGDASPASRRAQQEMKSLGCK